MQKLNIMYIIYENKMVIYIKNKQTSYIQYLELEFHGKSKRDKGNNLQLFHSPHILEQIFFCKT